MRQRYSMRKGTQGKVRLSYRGCVAEGRILDLSVPGCLLECAVSFMKGQELELRVVLDNQVALHVPLGIVRWANGTKAGVEFIRMSEADQAKLRRVVEAGGRRPPERERMWHEPVVCTGLAGD